MDKDFIVSILEDAKNGEKDPRIKNKIEMGIDYIEELKSKINLLTIIAVCMGIHIVINVAISLLKKLL